MPDDARQRELHHDISHQLGTIKLLAALLPDADDIGPLSRRRAKLLMSEMLWLEKLVTAARTGATEAPANTPGSVRPLRLDYLVADVLRAARANVCTRVRLAAEPALVAGEPIALGRAVRNIVWNGLDAAGPAGELQVRIRTGNGWVTLDVTDDGPGLGRRDSNGSGLGLQIVRDVVAGSDGRIELHDRDGGGCTTRVTLPLVQPHDPLSVAAVLEARGAVS